MYHVTLGPFLFSLKPAFLIYEIPLFLNKSPSHFPICFCPLLSLIMFVYVAIGGELFTGAWAVQQWLDH